MFFGELCHHCVFPQVGIYEHVNIGHGFKYTRISPFTSNMCCICFHPYTTFAKPKLFWIACYINLFPCHACGSFSVCTIRTWITLRSKKVPLMCISLYLFLCSFSGICFLIYLHFTFDQSSTCFTTFSNFKPFLPFIQAVCECVPLALFDAITWLGYCNSTINPIIYPLFMRDFKRALGKLLPCCSSRSTRRPSPALSLSLRNSGEPNLASSPPSPLASDPTHPPATATDAVNLLDAEHAGVELPLLLPNQVDSLDWIWNEIT